MEWVAGVGQALTEGPRVDHLLRVDARERVADLGGRAEL